MNNDGLTMLFKYFSDQEYKRNCIHYNLNSAEVLKTENVCEALIPVFDSSEEDILKKEFTDIRRKLRDPDYRGLLPIDFTLVRKDGTKIAEAWEERHEAILKSVENDSPEFSRDSLNVIFQDYMNNPIRNSILGITNLLSDDNADPHARQYKCEFKLILEEIKKASKVEPSFACADHLLYVIEEPLDIIEKALGSDSQYFKQISYLVVIYYFKTLINIVSGNQTTLNLKEAQERIGQLYSYAIDDYTKSSLLQRDNAWYEIERSRKDQIDAEKASRLSEKIKRFALDNSSIASGGKRYTSPGLAVISILILGVASFISIFEGIASLFKKKRDI